METAIAVPEQRSRPDGIADARLAADGDVRAFERLYRSHVDRVYSLVRRMLGEELADEVTQDVFVRAWRKVGTFRGDAAFGTWLHRLAINVVLARRRKLAIRRKRFLGDPSTVLETASPGRASPPQGPEFEAGLRELPAGAREVFVLHDIEGYKHREIAEMLGVTVGTTKAQLHRARMAMREFVARPS
ncbi:MAG: RNA polymerase sigma factor [Gemmatimonadota bacterium]